jgi:hypothetical protein
MGQRGPAPKRSSERRRRNKESKPEKVQVSGKVAIPPAEEDWHSIAKTWYESLVDSGQSRFYEPSDWAMAHLIAESLSRDLKPQAVGIVEEGEKAGEVIRATIPLKGSSLNAYLKAMTNLLVSEADRRRARLEIEREADLSSADKVAELDEYRKRVGG